MQQAKINRLNQQFAETDSVYQSQAVAEANILRTRLQEAATSLRQAEQKITALEAALRAARSGNKPLSFWYQDIEALSYRNPLPRSSSSAR